MHILTVSFWVAALALLPLLLLLLLPVLGLHLLLRLVGPHARRTPPAREGRTAVEASPELPSRVLELFRLAR